jgi:hypothetical protein
MTDGLSRRDLVLLAGAGIGLGACKSPQPATEIPVSRLACPKSAEFYGHWPSYGELPGGPPTYCQTVSKPNFAPDYITLIHIDFVGRWTMSINHACYYYPGRNAGERLRRAIELFGVKRPASGRKKRFSELKDENKPYKRQGRYDFDDFNEFGFASQHQIFFFFDNPNLKFDDDWLISFAPASDIDEIMDENYSFFNAGLVQAWLHEGTTNAGWIVRVDNYYTDPKGQMIIPTEEKPEFRYAMNLHFKIRTTTGYIPMIIDPETGNGAGNEP